MKILVIICSTIFLILVLLFQSLSFESVNINELEAVFIYKFLSFVYWPKKQKNITLCVIDRTSLKDYLLSFNGYHLETQNLIIRTLPLNNINKPQLEKEINKCEVLIIDKSIKNIDNIISKIKDKKILTISNQQDFIKKGGIVEIFTKNNKLRFKINYSLAKKSGIRISSKVLRLAEQVL